MHLMADIRASRGEQEQGYQPRKDFFILLALSNDLLNI